ncbi:MAG TPA: glycosyltransferase, partial [Salinibacter sp.]|nr:glycosyltransferase [Salinibacter sp.]
LAALTYKAITGTPVIVDTGDVISALGRSIGRGRVGYGLTVALEALSLRGADHLVVRGTNHKHLLGEQGYHNVTVVQDGVDSTQFKPGNGAEIRAGLDLEDDLVLGTLGSSVWNEQLQTCYGWEMLEVVHRLREHPIQALMIGGGSGIDRMKERAADWGIADRIHFLGYVPYNDLPKYLTAMDVCLSKQTNDLVGQVRTTGKLPLYMACGRYVLATKVGEAEYVLPDSMLIPFTGSHDPNYTDLLVDRVQGLLAQRSTLSLGQRNRDWAIQQFDYTVLSDRLTALLNRFT